MRMSSINWKSFGLENCLKIDPLIFRIPMLPISYCPSLSSSWIGTSYLGRYLEHGRMWNSLQSWRMDSWWIWYLCCWLWRVHEYLLASIGWTSLELPELQKKVENILGNGYYCHVEKVGSVRKEVGFHGYIAICVCTLWRRNDGL